MLRNEAAHLLSRSSGGFNVADLTIRGQAAATDIRRKEKAAEAAELFQEARSRSRQCRGLGQPRHDAELSRF
jgi:hypothetical protein